MLHVLNNSFKRIDVILVGRFHTQHNIAIHLYKTTIRIPCETRITRLTGQAFHNLIVQTQVQNSIHHTRHGSTGTRTYRYQQRIIHITELGRHQAFHM